MPYRRKPKYQKKKYIRKRTDARSQSKQIASLAKSISSINKQQYESIATVWNRPLATIDLLGGGVNAYICPIPVSMCNCYSQNTVLTQGDDDQRIQWLDNRALGSMDPFQKIPLFGSSENARDSPCVTHTGGYLSYRFTNNEPSFSTYSLFLVRPVKKHANQLVVDRKLKQYTTLNPVTGTAGSFTEGVDFITHPDVMGTIINRKYWRVLAKRSINFSHPNSTSINRTVSANNTNPKYNAQIAEGTIKIPGGTVIRNFNRTPYEQDSSPNKGTMKTSASQIGPVDEPDEKTAYLVVINNGSSADSELVKLSIVVKDFYKAVV